MADALVWADLEMTGLDPEASTILQIAIVVTDGELGLLPGDYTAVIRHDPKMFLGLDPAVRAMHERSGLFALAAASQTTLEQAEEGAIRFLAPYASEPRVLCGNSVHIDRLFIRKYMPRLDRLLHYRHIDVTSLKELARRWYPDLPRFRKAEAHTALADVKESIAELAYYRKHIFVPGLGPVQ